MSEDKEFSKTSETSSKFLGLKNKVFLKKLKTNFKNEFKKIMKNRKLKNTKQKKL